MSPLATLYLKRFVGLPEKRFERSVRSKRREFAAQFATVAVIPNSTKLSIGEETPHQGHFVVSRRASVGLNPGQQTLDFAVPVP